MPGFFHVVTRSAQHFHAENHTQATQRTSCRAECVAAADFRNSRLTRGGVVVRDANADDILRQGISTRAMCTGRDGTRNGLLGDQPE